MFEVLAAAPPGPSADVGLIDIDRSQDVPARVAHVVRFDHPVGGNLPLVTEVPLHHVSDLHVRRNADVAALRREDRGARERIAVLPFNV